MENLVTVVGTIKVKGTVIDAPMPSGPSLAGSTGLASVTVPDPESVRNVIWLILTAWAAVKPVLVSCKLRVTVVPDCETLDTKPLTLGAPQEPDPVTDVKVSGDVFAPSMFPVRSVAML